MRKLIFILFIILQSCDMDKDVIITISTPYGDMKAILYDETPLHKKNFIELLENHEKSITSSKEFNHPLRLFQEKLESLKLLSKQNSKLLELFDSSNDYFEDGIIFLDN